jgi:hypothetical protein
LVEQGDGEIARTHERVRMLRSQHALSYGEHLASRFPRFPGFFGKSGDSDPDSAGIGKQGIPDSRFGRNRESGSRFGGPGISWSACRGLDMCGMFD